MPPMTIKQRKLIATLADCDMRPAKTAQVLGCHLNTVYNRMDKIQKQTGLDPRCFHDLCKLYRLMEEQS